MGHIAAGRPRPTIIDKCLGTVVQFERFLTQAKLYSRATNTLRPYPLPPPHRQCWNRQGTIPLIFQHCIGWGGGKGHGFVKRQHCFLYPALPYPSMGKKPLRATVCFSIEHARPRDDYEYPMTRRQRELQQNNRFNKQNNNFEREDYDVKMPSFAFYG